MVMKELKLGYSVISNNILINLTNIKNQEELDNFETTLSSLAFVDMLKHLISFTSIKINI